MIVGTGLQVGEYLQEVGLIGLRAVFLQIENIDLFPEAVLDIYDRWGRLVYHAKGLDPLNVWDGKAMSGRELPMDSYYYVIDLHYKGLEPLVGYINIVR